MNILITGGSGLVGKALTQKLQAKGHSVAWLTRHQNNITINHFFWNIDSMEIDLNAIEWADVIIHLAGASIAQKRWDKSYKKEIYSSRINSTKLLISGIKKAHTPPQTLICASATGFYGSYENHEGEYIEENPAGKDFLATLTKDWEHEIFSVNTTIRTTALRIGIVLSKNGGAFKQIIQPIKYYVGAPLASGQQTMSWIHLDDLTKMFLFIIENESISGVINAVSPLPVSNKEMTTQIAKHIKRPILLPHVPVFILSIVLGEFAQFATKGVRVSSKKIENLGFKFKYPSLSEALKELI